MFGGCNHLVFSHHDGGPGVAQDVLDLVLQERRVDQHRYHPAAQRTQGHVEIVETAGSRDGEAVARAQPRVDQPPRRPRLGLVGQTGALHNCCRHGPQVVEPEPAATSTMIRITTPTASRVPNQPMMIPASARPRPSWPEVLMRFRAMWPIMAPTGASRIGR